jgi:UDP-glucose 4-epimerase
MSRTILLTGGAGYIGSHTYLALVAAGYRPLILDDFSNSNPDVPTRLEQITDARRHKST